MAEAAAAGRSLAAKPGRLECREKSLKLKKLKQPAMLSERTQERIYAHFERPKGRRGIRELGVIRSESSRPRSSDNG